MVIDIVNPDKMYHIFFIGAFFVAFIYQLAEGLRLKLPTLRWLLVILLTNLLFIIGSKLFTYTTEEWVLLFKKFYLTPTTNKTIVGGVFLGSFGLIVFKKWLLLDNRIFEAVALSIPLSFGIQRIGCFLYGCCYGKPCVDSVGVHYTRGSYPYLEHLRGDLIDFGDAISASIYPVQLYEAFGMLLMFQIALRLKNKLKFHGSLLVLIVFLCAIVRFTSEFFRDEMAHTIGRQYFLGFNTVQIGALLIILITILMLYYLEYKYKSKSRIVNKVKMHIEPRLLIGFIFVIIIVLVSKEWFTTFENLAISIFIFPVLVVLLYKIMRQKSGKTKYALYFVGLFILMSQTLPVSELDSLQITKYHSLKLGMGQGNFHNSIKNKVPRSGGCAGGESYGIDIKKYKHEYNLFSGGYMYSIVDEGKQRVTNYSFDVLYFENKETRIRDGLMLEHKAFSINPAMRMELDNFGYGFGLHMGNIGMPLSPNKVFEHSKSSSLTEMFLMPNFNLRLGNQKILYLKYYFNENFPSPFPSFKNRLEIGTGFGLRNNLTMSFGTNFHDIYLSGFIPIKNRIVIEPMYLKNSVYFLNPTYNSTGQFSIGVHYIMGNN